MSKHEVHAELLLGRRVRALNGRVIGRLEEIRVELQPGKCLVQEFLIGRYAMLERFAALSIGRSILHIFGARSRAGGYRIPWNQLDLTDPLRPRLLCELSALPTVDVKE